MKKYLVAICSIISFGLSAQSLSVDVEDYYYGVAGEECKAELKVENLTTNDLSVIVTRSNMDLPEGVISNFCWGITCYGSDTDVSSISVVIPAGDTFAGFTGYLNGMLEESTFLINYCFVLENDPLDKVCVDVTYTSIEDLSVDELSANYDVYPNPVKDVLYIDYNASALAEFSIYDMLGNRVYDDVLTSSMSLNLSSFEAGIYFYTFRVQGKEAEVQKLVITH